MAKKMISRFLILSVLTVFLAACSQQTKVADYVQVIPADASVVASINLKALAEKAGLSGEGNEVMRQKLLNIFASDMTVNLVVKQLGDIISNPAKSGIEIESPLYFFTATAFAYPTLIAQVKDEKALNSTIETMIKEQGSKELTDAGGYKFTNLHENLLVFNDKVVMFVHMPTDASIEEVRKKVGDLLNQSADKSFAQSKQYKQLSETTDDIAFFVSKSLLASSFANQMKSILPIKDQGAKNNITLTGALNFENERITANIAYDSEEPEVKALFSEYAKAFKKIDNKFLKYFPDSTNLFINIGINGKEFYNLTFKDDKFNFPSKEAMKQLIQSINGDITIGSTTGFMFDMRNYDILADVDNEKALEEIGKDGITFKDQAIELNKNNYLLGNTFYGIKDGYTFVTGSENTYKNIGKVYEKSIKDAPFAAEMKNKQVFCAINGKVIPYFISFRPFTDYKNWSRDDSENYQQYLISQVSYLSISWEGQQYQANFVFKDQKTNALIQIINIINEFPSIKKQLKK